MTPRRLTSLALTAVVAVLVWVFLWPTFLGGAATYTVVAGPSMEPTYESGDLVIVREQRTYSEGDIIAYDTENGPVIHRIVDGDGTNGYITQGDNNDAVDSWQPTHEDVIGKPWLHVPEIGNYLIFARWMLITPPFPYALAGAVFLYLVLRPDRTTEQALHTPTTEPAGEDTALIVDSESDVTRT